MKPRFFLWLAFALLGAAPAWTQITLNSLPIRTAGHPVTPVLEQGTLYSFAANLVEGRELYAPRGVAVDASVSPSPIYVADTYNNRVLGWRDATAFTSGQMADIVIGQNDFFTTWPEGPTTTPYSPGLGSPLQSGLTYPTGLAALNGDLYVVDNGNNRVLRYPKPFASANGAQLPDLVIGQPSFTSTTANYTGKVSAKGVSLSSTSSFFAAGIAFDANGNLWMTDPGNKRVLEFAHADIAASGAGIAATVALGQPDLVTVQATSAGMGSLSQFAGPAGIAIDSAGRVYVSDSDGGSTNRVLAFVPADGAFASGQAAANLLGLSVGQTGAQAAATALKNPIGIFCLPGNGGVGVADAGNNRVLLFQRYDLWPLASTATPTSSAQAVAVVGQNGDFNSTNANATPTGSTYTLPPSGSVFSAPMGAAVAADQLFVVDTGNNRLLAMPLAGSNASAATRVLGQDRMDTPSINLIEGREFRFAAGGSYLDAGVAIDSTGPVQRLYVADTYNNRILAFNDLRKVAAGVKADLVIGQPNGQTALCNYPTGDPARPTASSLCGPTGLVVDSAGNLWVADRGNGRVLRFPAPFGQAGQPQADLVLGQPSFTNAKFADPTSSTMSAPYGVAISQVSGKDQSVKLAVSDQVHNRVLVFQSAANGAFTNGQTASIVIGQSDFRGSAAGSGAAALYAPHHIALDSSDRLYVADTANNRVAIYDTLDNQLFPTAGASAVLSLTKATSSSTLNGPAGVYVNPSTGEIWVADTYNGRYLRYPAYLSLLTSPLSATSVTASSYTLALAQDAYGALLTADGANRVALYFPGITATCDEPGGAPVGAGHNRLGGSRERDCPVRQQFGRFRNGISTAHRYAGSAGAVRRRDIRPAHARAAVHGQPVADQLLCADGRAHQRLGEHPGRQQVHRAGIRRGDRSYERGLSIDLRKPERGVHDFPAERATGELVHRGRDQP